MLANKEVLGLDSARTKVVRVGGSALSLSHYFTYGSSSFSCKNLSYCCFPCVIVAFCRLTCILPNKCCLFAFTRCRTVTLSLCQYQLLGSEQKGVLFDCNPTHLSLESGAFSLWLRRHNDILCLSKARRRLTSVTLHAS